VKRILLALLIALFATSAFAWGEKGHYMSNEAATFGLPNDMPQFFYQAFPEIVHLAYDPDRWRGAGESADAWNPPDHFLDYDFVADLKLPPGRYAFIALLESSGTLRKHGIANDTTGFVPWRIAEMTQLLERQFRLWRSSRPGSREREYIERDIINLAGILGHYVADSANPHHATFHYNGWVAANPNGYANDCEIHGRFESDFVSHAIDLADVTPRLAAPQQRTDYFETALALIRSSNALVERLYQIDRDGGFDVFRPVTKEGKDFTADRLAVGASVIRDYWWSAWRNSANRPPRRSRD
jgi:hypothetical protein